MANLIFLGFVVVGLIVAFLFGAGVIPPSEQGQIGGAQAAAWIIGLGALVRFLLWKYPLRKDIAPEDDETRD
jgi:spore maturation protein SpmA